MFSLTIIFHGKFFNYLCEEFLQRSCSLNNLYPRDHGSCHGKSKGDGAGGTLKVQLDKLICIQINKFHHNLKEFYDYCKEKLCNNHDNGRTCPQVFHFLTPDQVIKKEDEKDFERFPGTLKI